MCNVKLCLEIKLQGDVLLPVAGLPPGHLLLCPGGGLGGLPPMNNTSNFMRLLLSI